MEIKDILTLVQAGYTKEEIQKMENPAPVPAPDPAPAPAPDPAPAPAPDPAPDPAPAPAPAPAPDPNEPTISDLMQSIAKLTSTLQANAIKASVIPGGAGDAPRAEDALAEIIRPTFKERT